MACAFLAKHFGALGLRFDALSFSSANSTPSTNQAQTASPARASAQDLPSSLLVQRASRNQANKVTSPMSTSPPQSPPRSPRSPREVALFGSIINIKAEEGAGKTEESSVVTEQYTRALEMLSRAHELAARVLPNEHFHLASIRIDMGHIHYRRGNYQQALGRNLSRDFFFLSHSIDLFNGSLSAFGNDEKIHYR